MMCVYVGGCVGVCSTPDRNDLELGTLEILDTMSQPTDYGFER